MAATPRARVLTYGERGEVRAEAVRLRDDLTSEFRLCSPWGQVDVLLAARGRHNVDNALAAVSAGLALGVSIDAIPAALATALLSPWRMDLQCTPSGARVLNDAYNANPVSMRAALEALAQLPAAHRVAVLGEMAELGAESDRDHREVAAYAAHLGMRVIAVAAPHTVSSRSRISMPPSGDRGTRPDDAVLGQGSRVAGLERLAARLTAAGA
jgi:UDP-N-acetylmuramoyl-tripeptide--D-alanyl-D-alanine ligase